MYLKINLQAALQSWGGPRINGDYFTTEKLPTKSGITGLIACVMGIGRDEDEIKMLADRISVSCIPYKNDGILTDYHVINITEKRPVYLANGELSTGAQAMGIVTRRGYIQTGEFDIYISADADVLNDIEYAFLHPYWTPYLGRKSCPVSSPIIPCRTEELPEEAIPL